MKGINMKKILVFGMIAILLASVVIGCGWSRKNKGVAIGAGAGAVIGGIIGDKAGNTAAGAILGAAVGGIAGGIIGNYMDKQAEEIERDLEGAKVERIGEGIKITFDSGILFDVNKSDLKPVARENLTKLATILNKYEDTEILVEGHTDSTGPHDYNMDLSLRRAQSVANQLTGQQVLATRLHIMGYGPDQPVAGNDTDYGRQQNRRVDIAIYANNKLKKAAEKQAEERG
jgi:outer membrane protein OmpA-like peptidoglycan-associated protein